MRIFSHFSHAIILLALLCASCGTALPTIKPYKLDVQQGNVVTSKMLLQLRPGMTRSQVRFVMGTPLIQDSFHGNRWDYVYQMREKGKVTDQRRVILDFEGDALKTVRGDVAAQGPAANGAEGAGANTGTRVINPSAKPEEKSFFSKLKFWEKDEAQAAKESETAKAKVEADEAAKNTAAQIKEELEQQRLAPENESLSILAVPVPMIEVPAEVAPVDLPRSAESAEEKAITAPKAEGEVTNATNALAAPYEPATNMRFDRKLKRPKAQRR